MVDLLISPIGYVESRMGKKMQKKIRDFYILIFNLNTAYRTIRSAFG